MARKGRSKTLSRVNRKSKPLSQYVRGVISGETYFKLSGQKIKG